jgi:hypothetical protein
MLVPPPPVLVVGILTQALTDIAPVIPKDCAPNSTLSSVLFEHPYLNDML